MKPIPSPLRYPGGKFFLRKLINSVTKPHRVLVDLCCGGLNVTLGQYSDGEVANDINPYLINFYRESQQGNLNDLVHTIKYDEETFNGAADYMTDPDPTSAAIKFLIRNRLSRDGLMKDWTFSERLRRGKPEGISSLETVQANWNKFAQRISKIEFLNMDALSLVDIYKTNKDCVLYLDLPYVINKTSKRKSKNLYKYEVEYNFHIKMLDALQDSAAQVIISHFDDPIYNDKLKDWARYTKDVSIMMGGKGDGAKKTRRQEIVWSNF